MHWGGYCQAAHFSARCRAFLVKAQRLRVRYGVAGPAASLTHRQLMQAWQEAAESSGLRLAYSEGKRPTPQISIAAPLPVGVTSEAELVDLFLTERVDPRDARARLARALPAGMEVAAAWEVGLAGPSLQSRLRWAEYEAQLADGAPARAEVQQAIERLLAADSLPWEQRRETKVRRYDLRPLVLDLRLEEARDGSLVLSMRLRAEQEIAGRADQVVAALGLPPPARIHRRRLYVEETQAALLAYRRLGEPGPE